MRARFTITAQRRARALRCTMICFFAFLAVLCVHAPPVAADEPANWWERSHAYRHDPYLLQTDLPRDEARAYLRHLAVMHAAFMQTLGDLPRRGAEHYHVLIFRSQRDYLDALHERYSIDAIGTGGLFIRRPETTIVALWIGDQPRSRVLHVLQHEAFHQFAHTRFGTDLPAWVNEGFAEYFGSAILVDRRFVAGQARPALIDAIQNAVELDRHVPFRELFRMDNEQWWRELRRGRGPLVYHQSWSMVHFLLHGDNGQHTSTFKRYLRLLAEGVNADLAFSRAFGANDAADAFERAWRAHVVTLKPGPFVTALEHIEFLAAGALELSRRGQRPMTLNSLRDALDAIHFTHTMSMHGISMTLAASEESVFSIPASGSVRQPPHFLVSVPPRRVLPRREQILELENPRPARIRTVHLQPRDLAVQWLRDPETNSLRYEIVFE